MALSVVSYQPDFVREFTDEGTSLPILTANDFATLGAAAYALTGSDHGDVAVDIDTDDGTVWLISGLPDED